MKKLTLIISVALLLTLFGFVFVPDARATEQEVKASVAVGALVPTTVVADESIATISTQKVLADDSQSATISVVTKDASENPVVNAFVFVYSNRGSIDEIVPLDANNNEISRAIWGVSVAHAATKTINGNTGAIVQTDATGQAHFKIRTKVPGEAIITVMIDGQIKLAEFKVTFLALPFPKYVSIGFQVPKFINKTGEISVLKPTPESESAAQTEGGVVNLGAHLVFPFWVVSLITLLIILTPILFAVILFLLARIKRISKEEKVEIEKTEQLVEKEEQEIEKLAANGSGPKSPSI
jgi:hypothetical protein